uniref:DUF834 domain-containing protein n=1 Tax=Oryza glumipatula TaxID=40148 RepID=A0A0E0A597_9ORYZ
MCLRFLAMKPMGWCGIRRRWKKLSGGRRDGGSEDGSPVEIDANQAGIEVDRRLGKELEGDNGESVWHEGSKDGEDEDRHDS